MAILKNLSLSEAGGRYEIRVDWDNDRHQAIRIDTLDTKGVIIALHETLEALKEERNRGNI